MGRGHAWLDTGTHESLLEAGTFIADHRETPGPEDRLPRRDRLPQGYIDAEQVARLAEPLKKNAYGSRSARGVLRGIHYQLNQPQGKLVRVVSGAVFDVAVDLRKSSLHFGKWVGYELSADNKRMMWVPPGFGHGFLVLSESADFLYKTTAYYAPQWDRGVRWNDPDIGVQWPLEGARPELPALSAKDQTAPLLKDAEVYP
jgi:dTDP-4-dehydrorhamnose 3,5-epimerase